jgi:hypothetical protein
MKLKTAIEILDYHQKWRLGKRDDMIHEPKKLTEAFDIVLSEVKKYHESLVTLGLPSVSLDERREAAVCAHDWEYMGERKDMRHRCKLCGITK